MPTTPIGSNGLIKIRYLAAGDNHVQNIRVFLKLPIVIGEEPTIKAFSGTGADRSASDFVSYYWNLVKVNYLAADSLTGYEVYDVSSDPPLFLFAQTASIAGTHTGEHHQTREGGRVITLRDVGNKKVKLNFFGSVDSRISKITIAASSVFATLIADLASTTPTGKMQDYFVGRSGLPLLSFISECGGANNALEKKILFG